MKLVKHFDSFLVNKVNLRDTRIVQLDSRVNAVTNFLSAGDDAIAERYVSLIPQGSYAHRTIINPVGEFDEFDADVLLELEENPEWEAEDYVQQLYTVFRSSSTYKGMVSRHARCVKVDYANEFHIDVVPYITRHDENYITNRDDNTFERTNPEGFNEWLEDQNDITSGRLIKVIRLMKYLRDYKNTFSVKSVILTILLAGRVNSAALLEDAGAYKDTPTALKTIIDELNQYLQANPTMPMIEDPACPGETYNHRWKPEEYTNFRNKIERYAAKIAEAYDPDLDRETSLSKWRDIFGDSFGTFGEAPIKASRSLTAAVRNTEQFLDHDLGIGFSLDHRYSVAIDAETIKKSGFRNFQLRRHGNVVGPGRKIKFSVHRCTVPLPYDIYWKVKNTGSKAVEKDCIRGQIELDTGAGSRVEPTSFGGKHFVECYIVKDGVCVAMAHQTVHIK